MELKKEELEIKRETIAARKELHRFRQICLQNKRVPSTNE